MITKIQKWGNSQGLRLSKQVLDLAQIAVGDELELVVADKEIILRKSRPKKYDLTELLDRLPRGYRGREVSSDPPRGREEW